MVSLLIVNLAHAENNKCGKLGTELFNLTWEVHEEFKKTKSAKSVMDKYQSKLLQKTDEIDRVIEKRPECKSEFEGIVSEAMFNLKDIQAALKKTSIETVSYDEWFTLQSTGIKSGKKYSFIACVNGSRNVTSVQCHVGGSAAKRVFYNTDDMKDIEAKKKWVNTINEKKCVTAYVTGGEAFIVDLKDQNECK